MKALPVLHQTVRAREMKKYLTLTRAGIIEALQFRLSFVVIVVGNLLYLTVIYFLWKAIYASAGADRVNGMTFTDTLIYLVLATALFNFMEMYTVWEIGRSIQSGKIVLDIIKPMPYRRYLFWSFTGSFVTQFFLTFLPTFIVVCILTHGTIRFGVNIPLFILSVTMGIIINYSIDFIVGTICLYTESIWGINIMKQVIVLLFSGAVIPVAFFPETFKKVTFCLPFRAIYDAPLSILLSQGTSYPDLLHMFFVQLIWCVVMTAVSVLFWNVSLRQITVNGG
ncbi:MAG: ABC-2 family transporter protein [Lachnospiraceae bacterium]|nr:ABC-2 family transporter protein [Lachnospiraceae bacterium]